MSEDGHSEDSAETVDTSEAQQSIENVVPKVTQVEAWIRHYSEKFSLAVVFRSHDRTKKDSSEVQLFDDGWRCRVFVDEWSDWEPFEDLSDAGRWHLLMTHRHVQIIGSRIVRQLNDEARNTIPFLFSLEEIYKSKEKETPDE